MNAILWKKNIFAYNKRTTRIADVVVVVDSEQKMKNQKSLG